MSCFPSTNDLLYWVILITKSLRYKCPKGRGARLLCMCAVRAEQHPMSICKPRGCAEVPRHMPWCLYHPQAAITEEVHGSLECAEWDPRPFKLRPRLFADAAVEKSRIEFVPDTWVGAIRFQFRSAFVCRTWSEISLRVRKLLLNRTAMVKMGVATLVLCSASGPLLMASGQIVPEKDSINILSSDTMR